jgi:hypothetical protein
MMLSVSLVAGLLLGRGDGRVVFYCEEGMHPMLSGALGIWLSGRIAGVF